MAAVYRHMGTTACLQTVGECDLVQGMPRQRFGAATEHCSGALVMSKLDSNGQTTICVKPSRCLTHRSGFLHLTVLGRRAKLFVQDNKTKEAIKDLKMCLEDVDGAPKLREEALSLLTALQIGDSDQVENVTQSDGGYGGYGGY